MCQLAAHRTSYKVSAVVNLLNVVSAVVNLLNIELNSTCHLLALLGAHPILHVSRVRVKYGDAS